MNILQLTHTQVAPCSLSVQGICRVGSTDVFVYYMHHAVSHYEPGAPSAPSSTHHDEQLSTVTLMNIPKREHEEENRRKTQMG